MGRLHLLDRYVFLRGCAALLLIIILVISLVIGIDVVMRLRFLLDGASEGSRWMTILRFYGYSLPGMVSPLLPLAMAAAVIITCAPMLKRGEFIALTASGVSLRRAMASLLLLALILGGTDLWISNSLAPELETRRQAIEDQLGGQERSARIWRVEKTGTLWYANRVVLHDGADPLIEDLIIAPENGLIHAAALHYQDSAWVLQGPILRWQQDPTGTDHWQELDSLDCLGELSLPYDTNRLSQRLMSRQALRGRELWQRGGHLNRSLLASRYARLLLPLSIVLLVLPLFVRFVNRDQMLIAGLRALLLGLLPALIIAGGSMSADSSTWDPFLSIGLSLICALAPGIIAYARWRL